MLSSNKAVKFQVPVPEIVVRRERVHAGAKLLLSHGGGQPSDHNLANNQAFIFVLFQIESSVVNLDPES